MWPAAFFVLLAFALYGNTIGHGYALDDGIVIVENRFTHQGLEGIAPILSHDSFVGLFGVQKRFVQGGRYRPLSIVTFALEQAVFHGNPHVSHAINVLLYGLTGWLLYTTLLRLLARASPSTLLGAPAAAALLFMVHPIHTEVVANIKGRDEILALLCALVSLWFQLRHLERGGAARLVGAGLFFFLALLSKESALPFLFLYPLTLWFFTRASRAQLLPVSLVCLAATVLYGTLRQIITGGGIPEPPELLNNPFLGVSTLDRYATIFQALLRYLVLLAYPHPLTHDYYFRHVPIVGWSHPSAWLSLAIHAGLLWAALRGVRSRDTIAYGFLFYTIALSVASNLVVSLGVIMSERFLYIPSIGASIAAGAGFERLERRFPGRRGTLWARASLAAICTAFAVVTVMRNPAWHDNLTLFRTDVRTSFDSAKIQAALGGTLLDAAATARVSSEERRLLEEGIEHLRKAVAIYPGYGEAWLLLGDGYERTGRNRLAIEGYRRALSSWPNLAGAYTNLGSLLRREKDDVGSARALREILSRDPENGLAWKELGQTFEDGGKPDSAVFAYEKAVAADSNYGEGLARLGTAYGRYRGDLPKAAELLSAALRKGYGEEWVYANLGVALGGLGRYPQALQAYTDGLVRHPGSPELERGLGTTYRRIGDEAHAQEHEAKARAAEGGER